MPPYSYTQPHTSIWWNENWCDFDWMIVKTITVDTRSCTWHRIKLTFIRMHHAYRGNVAAYWFEKLKSPQTASTNYHTIDYFFTRFPIHCSVCINCWLSFKFYLVPSSCHNDEVAIIIVCAAYATSVASCTWAKHVFFRKCLNMYLFISNVINIVKKW